VVGGGARFGIATVRSYFGGSNAAASIRSKRSAPSARIATTRR